MLNIIRAGLQTTVQDQGRNGLRGQGVSLGGALDAPALYAANLLVGNRGTDAGLEVTLGECTVEFTRDGWMALTGAGCDAYLDKQRIWTGWNYPVRAGQRLVLHRPKRGMRSYLAVSGGIDVPKVLGSRSTDLTGGFGGLDGRRLKDGDVLPLGEVRRVPQNRRVLNNCCSITISVCCLVLNIKSLVQKSRRFSGVHRGTLALRATAWDIA